MEVKDLIKIMQIALFFGGIFVIMYVSCTIG